jgi:hypothetical protein
MESRTSTTISISTKTAKGATRTSTKSTTITATAVVTSLVTINQSIVSTQEQTQLTTLVLPETSTTLSTETTTTTSTVFETLVLTTTFSTEVVTSTAVVTASLAPVKRQYVSVLPDRPHPTDVPSNGTLNARQQNNGQCRPSIFTPDYIPSYASPCHDPRSYTTACLALRVTGKTQTLPASTLYLTQTITSTTTPTLVVETTKTSRETTTSTLILPLTSIHTSIQNQTTTRTLTTTSTLLTTSTLTQIASEVTTRTSTLLASEIATQTTVQTQTTTPTPTPASCSSFRLSVSGIAIGGYVSSNGPSEKMGFTLLPSSAPIFALDSANRVYEVSTNLYPNTDASGLYYVYQETKEFVEGGNYAYLTCDVKKKTCGVQGRGDARFWWCPVIGPPDALVVGSLSDRIAAGGWDCVEAKVGVECV